VWGVELAVMAAMVLVNAVLAAFEIALASVSMARLQVLVREKHVGAHAALRMKQDMEQSLAVIQLGVALVAAIAAATGGVGAEDTIAPALRSAGLSSGLAPLTAVAAVVLPLTALTTVFQQSFERRRDDPEVGRLLALCLTEVEACPSAQGTWRFADGFEGRGAC
jgi:putative hemolysin